MSQFVDESPTQRSSQRQLRLAVFGAGFGLADVTVGVALRWSLGRSDAV